MQIKLVQVLRQPLVEGERIAFTASQMKPKLVALHLPQRLLGQGAQAYAHYRCFGTGLRGDAANFQRRDSQVRAGAELASYAVNGSGEHRGAFGQHLGFAQRVVDRLELHQCHARQRTQKIGVEQLQQRVGQLGQMVFDLHDQASGQEGEVFHQVLAGRVRGGATEDRRQTRVVLDKVVTQFP